MRAFFLILETSIVFFLTTFGVSAQDATVTFSTGVAAREVQVTVKNGKSACGIEVTVSDGRVERKRLEPGESWTLTHAVTSDGTYALAVDGVPVIRGLRTVWACSLNGAASFSVASGYSAVRVSSGQGATANPRGPEQDMIVLLRKEWKNTRVVSSLDGGKRIANLDEVMRNGLRACIVKSANAYLGIPDAAVNTVANTELVSHLGQTWGIRIPVRNFDDCVVDEGKATARLRIEPEVMVVQRAVFPFLANSIRSVAQQYEPFHEIGQAVLYAGVDRPREGIAGREQAGTGRLTELEQLAKANSLEKVGSLTLGLGPVPENPPFCTLTYEGPLGAAVLGYVLGELTIPLEPFRNEAGSIRVPANLSRTYAKGYSTLDRFYEVYQTRPDECLVYVDFPSNLKRLADALQREGRPFAVNEFLSAGDLRNSFARQRGYANYAEYSNHRDMKVSAQHFKALAVYQVSDRSNLEAAFREMQSARYSDSNSVDVLLSYLKDRAEAAKRPGSTALSIKMARERITQEAADAQAASEQRRRQDFAREFPYIAVLTCGTRNHLRLFGCFSGGSRGLNTELKITNGSSVNVYKSFTLDEAGKERSDGFYIDLRRNFAIEATNGNDILILGLKIIDRATNRVIMEDKAGQFSTVSVRK